MAIVIKDIPTLRGKEAEKFLEKADKNLKDNRNSIDFRRQNEAVKRILSKSKL
ncbi:MAG: hypothetical protein RLZZ512_477 [Bacteroidota bacterium]|jgi:hypothetical protein